MRNPLRSIADRFLETSVGYRLTSAPVERSKARAITRLLGDCTGQRVLDVGCGPGTSAGLFAGADYLGIDINPVYIATARRQHPGLRFEVADATRLAMSDEHPFDVILINSFLHHLADREVGVLLAALRNCLAARGRLVIQEPLIPERSEWLPRLLMRLDRGDHFRSRDEWQRLVTQAGFEMRVEEQYRLPFFGIPTTHMISAHAALRDRPATRVPRRDLSTPNASPS